MKRVEAVIFDWAGTTVDYGCMAPIQAMKSAFSKQHLEITVDEIRQPMGMLKFDHIQAVLEMERVQVHFKKQHGRSHEAKDIQAIYDSFEETIFTILHQYSSVIKGMLTVQEYLRDERIKIGSTTGYTKKMIDIVANSAKEQGYQPDAIVSADQVPRGRPYPYMLQENLAILDVKDARHVVKVGDTVVDILEGLHAGCWSIGVICGSSMLGLDEQEVNAMPEIELKTKMRQVKYKMLLAGADFVIDSIDELPWAINVIQQRMDKDSH